MPCRNKSVEAGASGAIAKAKVKGQDQKYSFSIWAAAWQNQQKNLCAKRRLRSAWASAQSDQSLRCLHEEALGPWLSLEHKAKTLIRLGRCPVWLESSLGTQVILLVMSCSGSFVYMIWRLCIPNMKEWKKGQYAMLISYPPQWIKKTNIKNTKAIQNG